MTGNSTSARRGKKGNAQLRRTFCLLLAAIMLISIFAIAKPRPATAAGDVYSPGVYNPRGDKLERPAYLAGNFGTPGKPASIVVADENGDRKLIPFIGNSDWSQALIPMDCVSSTWGYFRVTLHLEAGEYRFKVAQKNSDNIGKDKYYWYGLDGYRVDTAKAPYEDIYNNDANGFNNVGIYMTKADDVTFYFVDGARNPFREWQPKPPYYAQDLENKGDYENAPWHMISAMPAHVGSVSGDGNGVIWDHYSDMWQWNKDGWWLVDTVENKTLKDRVRECYAPFWFDITEVMQSGTITESGFTTAIQGELFLTRRTQVNEKGSDGKWQVDNGEYPDGNAKDPSDDDSFYMTYTGLHYMDENNVPIASISHPRAAEDFDLQLYYDYDAQPAHGVSNNVVFKSPVTVNVAGVYTYYMSLKLDGDNGVKYDGKTTSYAEPKINNAADFVQGPQEKMQAVYFPTITMKPVTDFTAGTSVTIKGDSYGYSPEANGKNNVTLKLVGEVTVDDTTTTVFSKIYRNIPADKNTGLWELPTEALPAGTYTAKSYISVTTDEQLDPQSRTSELVNDAIKESKYNYKVIFDDSDTERVRIHSANNITISESLVELITFEVKAPDPSPSPSPSPSPIPSPSPSPSPSPYPSPDPDPIPDPYPSPDP
ncbi:MAG: hypothetical protein LBN30_01040, partial [Oscillospiraceae bacterium]|nr:hypothetical protein [Oscillospiraceae bacterium]